MCADDHKVPTTCDDVCSLADAICDNAEAICTIADELGKDDDFAQDKCTSAKASCREAKQKCCGCSSENPVNARMLCAAAAATTIVACAMGGAQKAMAPPTPQTAAAPAARAPAAEFAARRSDRFAVARHRDRPRDDGLASADSRHRPQRRRADDVRHQTAVAPVAPVEPRSGDVSSRERHVHAELHAVRIDLRQREKDLRHRERAPGRRVGVEQMCGGQRNLRRGEETLL